jgi:hypothetical protein
VRRTNGRIGRIGRSLAAVALASAVAVSIAGCAFGPRVALRTSPVASQACMDALVSGVLARDARSGLGIATAGGGATAVEWPFGYSARDEGDRIALVDENGKVVAREGDQVEVGGGLGNDDVWFACGGVKVVGR